jgi:hypothetical protein
MTEVEIEAELGNLRARITQLEQEQDSRKKTSAIWGRASLLCLVLYLALGILSLAMEVWWHASGAPPLYATYSRVLGMFYGPLIILTFALLVGQTPFWPRRQTDAQGPAGNEGDPDSAMAG